MVCFFLGLVLLVITLEFVEVIDWKEDDFDTLQLFFYWFMSYVITLRIIVPIVLQQHRR